MKYFLLIIQSLLGVCMATAQDYSCVAPGQKAYFTNAVGYLRGMRIDSTKMIDGNTVHYPFKSARLRYENWAERADIAGGSWLGKEIVETPGGFTYIPNLWRDTVAIKRDAVLYESWIFYRDTSARYYEAKVIAADTQTIDGVLDSVKIIELSAMVAGAVVTSDLLTGVQLLLSKAHGFVQAVEFYLFPYHIPGQTTYSQYIDCHFYESSRGNTPNRGTLVFKKVHYIPAYQYDIFNFQPGDRFNYNERVWEPMSAVTMSEKTTRTTITSRVDTDTMIRYETHRIINGTVYRQPGSGGPYSYADTLVGSQFVRPGLLIDTLYLPEEWGGAENNGRATVQYYFPEDSSFCVVSPKYRSEESVMDDGYFRHDRTGEGVLYKAGFGYLSRFYNSSPPSGIESSTSGYLQSARKSGNLCDESNGILVISDKKQAAPTRMLVYPNPAATQVNIELPDALPSENFILEVYDICGRKMITEKIRGGRATIATGNLPDGIYGFRLSGHSGSGSGKVVIRR